MKHKEKIKLQWQNHIYEVGIEKPLTRHPYMRDDDGENKEKFASSINDEPKQIAFYLCESLMEPIATDSIHLYLEKLFKREFSVGCITNKDEVSYFKIYESNDYGATVILVNNNEARMQLERSL